MTATCTLQYLNLTLGSMVQCHVLFSAAKLVTSAARSLRGEFAVRA